LRKLAQQGETTFPMPVDFMTEMLGFYGGYSVLQIVEALVLLPADGGREPHGRGQEQPGWRSAKLRSIQATLATLAKIACLTPFCYFCFLTPFLFLFLHFCGPHVCF
jgi:hypothetical protein